MIAPPMTRRADGTPAFGWATYRHSLVVSATEKHHHKGAYTFWEWNWNGAWWGTSRHNFHIPHPPPQVRIEIDFWR